METPPASVKRGSNHSYPAGSVARTVGKRRNPIAKQTTHSARLETPGKKPSIANETSSPKVAKPPTLLESNTILSVEQVTSTSGFVGASAGPLLD